jgi:hypothetical protein
MHGQQYIKTPEEILSRDETSPGIRPTKLYRFRQSIPFSCWDVSPPSRTGISIQAHQHHLTYIFFEITRRTQTRQHSASVSLPRGSTVPSVPNPILWGSSITPRHTPHAVGTLRKSDRSVTETPYLTRRNTHNGQTSAPPHGIRTRNPGNRMATDPHLRPRDHRFPCVCFSLTLWPWSWTITV